MAMKLIESPDPGICTSDVHAVDGPDSGIVISAMAFIRRIVGCWRNRRTVREDLIRLADPDAAGPFPDQPSAVLEADTTAARTRRDDWRFCPKSYEFDLMTRSGAARP